MAPIRKSILGLLPRARRSTAVLPIVFLLLFGSAALRIASEAGQALAQAGRSLPRPAPGAQPAAMQAKPETSCPTDPEIGAILKRLNEREESLSQRDQSIAGREAALRAAEERLRLRIEELKSVEAHLVATMAKTATAAEDDVSSLVSIYAAMKPKEAAALFEAMAPDFAAGFLRRMRPDAAAPIFAGLSPTHAYAVSAVLAGRNAEVPVPPVPQTPKPDG